MSRKSCKRILRLAVAPAMVTLHNAPEVSIANYMAIETLKSGLGTHETYRVLSDCQCLLSLAWREKKDNSTQSIADFAYVAMLSIHDRHKATGKWGATGDELNALRALVEYADDYWMRQSGAMLNRCINKLRRVREYQRAELLKKAA